MQTEIQKQIELEDEIFWNFIQQQRDRAAFFKQKWEEAKKKDEQIRKINEQIRKIKEQIRKKDEQILSLVKYLLKLGVSIEEIKKHGLYSEKIIEVLKKEKKPSE